MVKRRRQEPDWAVLSVLAIFFLIVIFSLIINSGDTNLRSFAIDYTDIPYADDKDLFFPNVRYITTDIEAHTNGGFFVDIGIEAPLAAPNFYVYKYGYYTDASGTWIPLELEAVDTQSGSWADYWIKGSADVVIINLADADYQVPGYAVVYICREYSALELDNAGVEAVLGTTHHDHLMSLFGTDQFKYFCGPKKGASTINNGFWRIVDFASPTSTFCDECTDGEAPQCGDGTNFVENCVLNIATDCYEWTETLDCTPDECDGGVCIPNSLCSSDADCTDIPAGLEADCVNETCRGGACDYIAETTIQLGGVDPYTCTTADGKNGICAAGVCVCKDFETNSTVCGTRDCGMYPDACGVDRQCGSCGSGTCNANGECEGGCTPSCPAASTINCGTTYTGDNGCGTPCNVVGTKNECSTAYYPKCHYNTGAGRMEWQECISSAGCYVREDTLCGAGQLCNAAGCYTPGCTPSCTGKSCGADDNCGSPCTSDTLCTSPSAPYCDNPTGTYACVECETNVQCSGSETCNAGSCESTINPDNDEALCIAAPMVGSMGFDTNYYLEDAQNQGTGNWPGDASDTNAYCCGDDSGEHRGKQTVYANWDSWATVTTAGGRLACCNSATDCINGAANINYCPPEGTNTGGHFCKGGDLYACGTNVVCRSLSAAGSDVICRQEYDGGNRQWRVVNTNPLIDQTPANGIGFEIKAWADTVGTSGGYTGNYSCCNQASDCADNSYRCHNTRTLLGSVSGTPDKRWVCDNAKWYKCREETVNEVHGIYRCNLFGSQYHWVDPNTY